MQWDNGIPWGLQGLEMVLLQKELSLNLLPKSFVDIILKAINCKESRALICQMILFFYLVLCNKTHLDGYHDHFSRTKQVN